MEAGEGLFKLCDASGLSVGPEVYCKITSNVFALSLHVPSLMLRVLFVN